MIATQRPIAATALSEVLTSAAWTNKPSWQIRPLLDPVISQEEFKFEAERADSHVTEVNSPHAIPVLAVIYTGRLHGSRSGGNTIRVEN